MFSFTPLQGALSESTASQSLLELDGGVKVLVDVGWDESFDAERLRELEKYACHIASTWRPAETRKKKNWLLTPAD
jgi:hypothetical protein